MANQHLNNVFFLNMNMDDFKMLTTTRANTVINEYVRKRFQYRTLAFAQNIVIASRLRHYILMLKLDVATRDAQHNEIYVFVICITDTHIVCLLLVSKVDLNIDHGMLHVLMNEFMVENIVNIMCLMVVHCSRNEIFNELDIVRFWTQRSDLQKDWQEDVVDWFAKIVTLYECNYVYCCDDIMR